MTMSRFVLLLFFALAVFYPAPKTAAKGLPAPDYTRPVFSGDEAPLLAAPEAKNPEERAAFNLSLQAGFRTDQLRWHIAGGGVNILSELITDDIRILQVGLKAVLIRENAVIFAEAAHGEILGGTSTDRDYNEDDRKSLYSESVADLSGHRTRDYEAGAGWRLDFLRDRCQLTPFVGGSHHQLKLLKKDGVQTVATPGLTPPVGPIEGLASTYDATWNTLWAGTEFRLQPTENLQVGTAFRHRWFNFRANAGWNLRQDLAQPISFRHRASGRGMDLDLFCRYAATDRLELFINVFYKNWTAKNGTDTTYLADGRQLTTTLNRVYWQSRSFTVGLIYRF